VIAEIIENVETIAAIGKLQVQYHEVRTVPRDQFDRAPAVSRFADDLEARDGIGNRTYAQYDLV
jgi:hypothetical protein